MCVASAGGATAVARGRERYARKVDRSEGLGEWLLGALLDRAQQVPPQLIAPLVAEEAARIGGRDVCILVQDYGQRMLRPLPGRGLRRGSPSRSTVPRPAGPSCA
jgi:phosphoserine phosphatase RsbU/P